MNTPAQRSRLLLISILVVVWAMGCNRSPPTDFDRVKKSAEKGDAGAQVKLGKLYSLGKGVEANDAEAVKWFRRSAERWNAAAQFNLGMAYYHGRGVEKDERQAILWFQKSAAQGFAEAQYSLGILTVNGKHMEKNEAEALRLFHMAAAQGHKGAQDILKEITPPTPSAQPLGVP